MKAKIRKTGEIVDVISYGSTSIRNKEKDYVKYIGPDGKQCWENLNYYWDFEPIEDVPAETDWQALRNQYAGLAMQAFLSIGHNITLDGDVIFSDNSTLGQKTAVKYAVEYADALIEELKKK